jgi:hypothetical protein
MVQAETLRAKAAECDELARTARDPKVKDMFAQAAHHWRTLADQLHWNACSNWLV